VVEVEVWRNVAKIHNDGIWKSTLLAAYNKHEFWLQTTEKSLDSLLAAMRAITRL